MASYYTASVGEAFIYDMMGNGPFQDLTRWEKQIASCVNVLTEFMETDSVKFKRSKVSRELSGPIGLTMREYIQHRKELGISISTEDEYRYHLEQVLNYLGSKSINTVSQISNCIIIDYANSMGFAPANTRSRNLSILKGYLRYLYESNKRGNCKTKCKPLPPAGAGASPALLNATPRLYMQMQRVRHTGVAFTFLQSLFSYCLSKG